VQWERPRPARPEELAWVHHPLHVEHILGMAGRSCVIDEDTATSPGSVEAALAAAGAALGAAKALLEGQRSFALCRPPGHHASRDRAMGFCLFNNAALAAEALARQGRRVLVFDPDLHHGNGTQDIFYSRGDVLVISMHRWPFWPGSGRREERGEGQGLGATLNCPMREGADDHEYHEEFRQRVLPAVEAFRPDCGVISAGFDALLGDPLGDGALSPEGLAAMWAEICARTPCLAVLEGGYSLPNLEKGVAACAGALAG
jgi:acetoin utilization deacetylase AcuC-like enzyme